MALQATTKLTYDDYVLIPDDSFSHEIIDGEHYVKPTPNIRHQLVSAQIVMPLVTFVEDHRLGEVLFGPLDIVFSNHDVVQPDILYSSRELHGEYVDVVPELVVEILSTSNRKHDEVRKLKVYDTFNVPEYWIVDPEDDLVSIYRRRDAVLTLVEKVDIDGTITSPLFPGFALAAHTVFA